ncbi:unnamed protein product [Symbiodinium necroappetens]|uniref:C3H1-type domain-containing protein n=1 Tax=Symbiodinium necroappetens TaxID=1628268 RepID=A0A812ZMZ3_9DINO|nr:unnamed protein product [Symbiodinium necroappetens]
MSDEGRYFQHLATQATGESELSLLTRSYEGMLGSIRKGLFLPDATRSGLFRAEAKDSATAEPGKAAASSQDHWSLVRPSTSSPLTDGDSGPARADALPTEESDSEGKYYQAAALTPEAAAEEFLSSLPGDFEEALNDFTGVPSEVGPDTSSSSSSESSTSGSEDGPDWSDAFQGSLGAVVQKAPIEGPDFDFWRHDRTLTIHSVAAGSTGETFTCGRKKTADYSKVAQSAFLETRLCSNCRKSKPVRDVGALNAILSKSGRPCDDGCEVQHAAQLNRAAARAFHEVRNREELCDHKGNVSLQYVLLGEACSASVSLLADVQMLKLELCVNVSSLVQLAFTESKAAFTKRALEVGLSQDEVDHLIGQHVDTLSKLAFVLVPPGRVPEEDAVVALLPAGATQGAVAGLKRLLFEAHTLVVSALKQRVEKTDDVVPASLDSAERDDRLASQKARLGGLTFQGEEEVAHGAYDLVFAMAQKNELVWLAPEKFGTRRAEIGAKKAGKELVIDGSGVAIKDKPSVHNCIIHSELDLVSALRRRALAFDLVGILSYDVANRYHQALIQRLQEAPPPGYSKVSVHGSGVLPLDAQLPTILLDPSVTYHLLPLPAGSSSSGQVKDDDKPDRPPKRPHDPPRRPPKKGAKRTNFSVPKELIGKAHQTPKGHRLCWGFNLPCGCKDAKPGGKCAKGLHLCAEPGCLKPHSLQQHVRDGGA